jgi:transposase-like protein/IS1 family transposase
LKPKSEKDCPQCQAKPDLNAQTQVPRPPSPRPWKFIKGKGGRKKRIATQGYACPNPACDYYTITDANIHALVGYGTHGEQETIQDFRCQACQPKFTARRHTVLYRLKTHSQKVQLVLWLLALGVDISALEEALQIRESTLRTWLSRSGDHSRKLHDRFVAEVDLVHVQLDELWANLKQAGQDVWVWVACEASTKLIPVLQLGGRTQAQAYSVVHELKARLKPGCVPVFSSDGLKHYFYALTAHFGHWVEVEGQTKPVWALLNSFAYAQVIKHQKRYRLVKVERRLLCGRREDYAARLKSAGLSGRINSAFVERVNLTIRCCVSKLARRTWGPAQSAPELTDHLYWWLVYYNFARYHESLRIPLTQSADRREQPHPQKYRERTPAVAAGLSHRRWTVLELISYPLP